MRDLAAKMQRQRERRLEKRRKAQRSRPRCLICMGPLPYGKPGFNLRAKTCSRDCAVKAWNWFGRIKS